MIKFKLVDWETEIVESIPNNEKELVSLVETRVMQWCGLKDKLFPMYKKTRSITKRSNMLRLLEYSFGKFIFLHEIYYKRNPLKCEWNPITELNTKNVGNSDIPIDEIETILNLFYTKK